MPRWLIFVLLTLTALTAQPVVSDLAIQTGIRDRLAKSVIGKDGFTVRVKDGVVYWDGSTTIAQHKGAATRMAKSVGARRVVNNIRVAKAKPAAPVSPAPVSPAPVSPKTPPKTDPQAAPAPVVQSAPPPLRQAHVEWQPIPVH